MENIERREFLIRGLRGGSLLLILPAGWTVAGCGSSTSGTDGGVTTINSGTGSETLRFTSSNVQGHTHDYLINMTDVALPPSAGVSGDTTVALDHTHVVSLSAGDLSQIHGGQTVSKDTSVVMGHLHTFQFSAAAASSASGGSGGSSGSVGGTSGGTGGTTTGGAKPGGGY